MRELAKEFMFYAPVVGVLILILLACCLLALFIKENFFK